MSDIFKNFDKKNEVPKVKIPKFSTGGICNDAIFPKLDVFTQIDEIVKDIKEQEDNAMAMEFTKCIGELLKKNGVVPKIKQYGCDFYGENSFQSRFGVIIDELDFSEHDKQFKERIGFLTRKNEKLFDENASLKQRIAEFESKESVKPMRIEFHADNGEILTPLEVANSLINQNTFKVDELKELAEHLQVYCRHNNDKEAEAISF